MEQSEREIIVREIKRWQEQGLLPAETCQKLLESYSLPPPAPAADEVGFAPEPSTESQPGSAPASPPARRTSISQLLLSETAVNTALYLGGFFIIIAAFIIAALVAEARLPILITATVIFLGGSLLTFRRLRQASLVLFLIGSLLIPIDALVIVGLIDISPSATDLYWSLACLLLSLVWAGGFLLYRNWITISLTFLGSAATVLLTANWLGASEAWMILTVSLVTMCWMLAAVLLQSRFGKQFFLPILILTQIVEIFVVCVLLGSFAFIQTKPFPWIVLAAGWLVAGIYYLLSDWLVRRWWPVTPFPFAAALCLGVFPLYLAGAGSPDANQIAWIAFAWGLVFSLVAEWFWHRDQPAMKVYSLAFCTFGALLFFGAVITQMVLERFVDGEIVLLVFGVLSLAFHLRQRRWWLWTLALLSLSLAYFNLFLTGPLENTTLPTGYIFLFPVLVFLSLELLLSKGWIFPRKVPTAPPNEYIGMYLPVLIFVAIYGFIDAMILLSNSGKAWSAQIFFVYALFFAVYAVLKARPILSLLATGSLALAVFYSLNYYEADHFLTPMLLLAVVYYLAGLGMAFVRRTRSWSDVFIWSGLGLGSLAAVFAPTNQDPFTILGVTIIAVCYAVEAWRQPEVWLGVPACLVLYLAYLTALLQLDVSQPQYYSIGAAVLGIVMHNLFLRSKNPIRRFNRRNTDHPDPALHNFHPDEPQRATALFPVALRRRAAVDGVWAADALAQLLFHPHRLPGPGYHRGGVDRPVRRANCPGHRLYRPVAAWIGHPGIADA